MKILIIQQKMIGDVLTSSILFELLKKQYPEAELHYLIQPHTFPVVENNPYIDRVIFDKIDDEGTTLSLFQFVNFIRSKKYDAIIDVYSKIGSALVTGLSKAQIKIGYKKWYTQFLYSHALEKEKISTAQAGLAIENRMLLLKPLLNKQVDSVKPKIYLTQEELALAKTILQKHHVDLDKKIIMISLLGSAPNKTYPLPYLVDLLECIVYTKEVQVLLNYIPDQQWTVEELLKQSSSQLKKSIFPQVYGKGLRQFMALASYCDALIGNEGGAINMAKALDIPTFAIFSPWIRKDAWNLYSGKKNEAVHLKDYKPQLFKSKKASALKKDAHFLYQEFNPELIKPKLINFLNHLD